jgi:hypothetical protein
VVQILQMLGMPTTKPVLQELFLYSQIKYFFLQTAKGAALLSPPTLRLFLLLVD